MSSSKTLAYCLPVFFTLLGIVTGLTPDPTGRHIALLALILLAVISQWAFGRLTGQPLMQMGNQYPYSCAVGFCAPPLMAFLGITGQISPATSLIVGGIVMALVYAAIYKQQGGFTRSRI